MADSACVDVEACIAQPVREPRGFLDPARGGSTRLGKDLYRLSGDLVLELDDPIVEAGQLVGFGNVQEGALLIKPLGQAYAEASILARKELIAGRILRLPVISWIYEKLRRDNNQRVAWSCFVDELKADFGDLREKQLDIAISWGRYAELSAYDDDAGELYLES